VPPPRWRLPKVAVRSIAICLQGFDRWPLKVSRVDALSSFVRYSTDRLENELEYRAPVEIVSGTQELVEHYRRKKS